MSHQDEPACWLTERKESFPEKAGDYVKMELLGRQFGGVVYFQKMPQKSG